MPFHPVSLYCRVIASLLCITTGWTPFAVTWAGSAEDAQQLAAEFSAGFEMPSMNNGTVLFPDAANPVVDLTELYPDAGDPSSMENLFGDDAGATAAGLTSQITLSTENSPQGEAYRTAAGLFVTPRPDMTDDPIFQSTDSIYADLQTFKEDFEDCTLTTTFTEGTTDGHIPDYRTCERIQDLAQSSCGIAHAYTADPATHTLVDAPWVTDTCVNTAIAIDNGICQGSYQCDDEPIPGPMTLDTVTVSVGALMVEETNIRIDLTTGTWSVTGTSDARDNIALVDHLVDYDAICSEPEINAVTQPIQDWPDVPFGNLGQGYDTSHCAQVVTPPSCSNGLVTTIRLLDNCQVGSGNSLARFGKKVPIELEGGNCIDLNGTIVCDPSLPQGTLTNVSPLCRLVGVDPQCSFNVGQMDCWTDPDGVEHCPQNDASVTDNCPVLANDSQCAFVSRECVDGAERNGTCYVEEETWDCGDDVGIPTLQRADTLACDGQVQCMAGSCVALPDIPSAESDFYQAASMLQAAQFIAMDTNCADPTNFDCELFKGEPAECKKAVGGIVDCCEKPDNVGLGDYVTLMFAIAKADNAIMDLNDGSRIRGAWQTLRDPVMNTWDAGREWVTTKWGSLTGTVTEQTTEQTAKGAVSAFMQQMTNQTAEWVANTFGTEAASMLFVAEGGGAQLFDQAGGQVVVREGVNATIAPMIGTALSVIMWAYTIYAIAMLLIQIIWECEQEEFELGAKRKLKSCHKVGSYCKNKALGQCIEKREAYCCYNSPLARIIQEQVHPQLGMSWGDEENPDCSGIPLQSLGQVNWAAVDLSEWVAILQASGQLNTLSSLNLDAITGAGSEFNIDGTRMNTQDRTRIRLDGLDTNTIRRDAESDLRGSFAVPMP